MGETRKLYLGTLLHLDSQVGTDLLLDELKSKSKDIPFIQELLVSSADNTLFEKIYKKMREGDSKQNVHLVNILSKRKDPRAVDIVVSLLDADDSELSLTALKCLPSVVNSADLDRMHRLLLLASDAELAYIQHALINTVRYSNQKDSLLNSLIHYAANTSEGIVPRYFRVLSRVGGSQGITFLSKYLSDPKYSELVINAIAMSNYAEAWELSYNLLVDSVYMSHFSVLYPGFLKQLSNSDVNEDRKSLALANVSQLSLRS